MDDAIKEIINQVFPPKDGDIIEKMLDVIDLNISDPKKLKVTNEIDKIIQGEFDD